MIFIKRSFIVIILLIVLIYTVNITGMPERVILFEDEKLNLGQLLGIEIKEKEKETLQASVTDNKIDNKTVVLSLFNVLNLKEIEVSTVKSVKVVPLGNTIGIKLYSDGVLVIGMTEVEGQQPYKNTGIQEGDLIIQVDNFIVTTTEELIECVNKCDGNNVQIKYVRDGIEHTTSIEPVKTKDDKYKIGLWVRDGAVGIGTATYYEPETKKVATLGHGIVDSDTDKLITIECGEIVTCNITKIKKGQEGEPGEIKGTINDEQIIGNINQNTHFGIYGTLSETNTLSINEDNSLEVALREEIKTGKAKILLTLEDGIRKEYEINIKKIYTNNNEDNKSMLIEITDKELIAKTGGIIQGMSGAPIIQNNKFVRSYNSCPNK